MSNVKNKKYDIAIIGGGAAGLFCAAVIKSKNSELSVAVLERQERVGRKLLATGNGRCNLTNLYATPEMYHGSFKHGAKRLLEICPPEMTVELFNSFGLLTTADSEGRVYPLSKQSGSVLKVLLLACEKYGVDILCDHGVTDIKKNKLDFTVKCEDKLVTATHIVVASGSRSTPETGANDAILSVIKKLGHTITPISPALCPVSVKSSYMKSLKGVRASGKVAIYKDSTLIKSEEGEIQFTDKALSGICVFNLSRIANTEENTCISVSLLPHLQYSEILSLLINKRNVVPKNTSSEEFLCGFFNKAIGVCLVKEAGIPLTKTVDTITDQELKKLANVINNWSFKVNKSSDFSRSQVTAGGVLGNEIDENTMQSKKVSNMYIIGEAVDCDGDCGGFNLQFAFASAYCAACELTR